MLHPIVKTMVDEMCEEAKSEMKSLPNTALGCWQQAVTSVWQTRGYHGVRNYINCALLYYMHCVRKGLMMSLKMSYV